MYVPKKFNVSVLFKVKSTYVSQAQRCGSMLRGREAQTYLQEKKRKYKID
jgi:hypothetical protein